MTKTLEDLFNALGDGDPDNDREYDRRRVTAVAGLADYIRGHIKQPDIAPDLAEAIMASAEEMGRIDGDDISGEVASRYTKTGNPLPFLF